MWHYRRGPVGRGYNNIPAFSSKSAGIKTTTIHRWTSQYYNERKMRTRLLTVNQIQRIPLVKTLLARLQGPVVQSVVSLTSSLGVISLNILADSIYNILIFFAEKMWVLALQKLLTFLQQKKIQHICVSLNVNFNESLTNDIVSFEQLGPD